MADDACRTAQTEYDALVQSWKEKQAAVAALNKKIQAAQLCDWENGDEFDAALEQSDERFSNLNKLIRTYIQAKEAETAAAQDQQEAKKTVQDADTAKAAAEQKKAAAKEAVEHGFSENKTHLKANCRQQMMRNRQRSQKRKMPMQHLKMHKRKKQMSKRSVPKPRKNMMKQLLKMVS